MLAVVALLGPSAAFAQEQLCLDGADDDDDALVDCADPDCGLRAVCCSGLSGDGDADGWCDGLDVCVLVADPSQADGDGDGAGDACDVCPTTFGDGLTGFGAYRVLDSWSSSGHSVHAADLDGDGDADVLTTSARSFAFSSDVDWIENLGGGTFGPDQLLTTPPSAPRSVYPTDLDGDGREGPP